MGELNTQNFLSFAKIISKLSGNRVHKVSNSYGVTDAFKAFKNKISKKSKYRVTMSEYSNIIKTIHGLMADSIVEGNKVNFPCLMGDLELRKFEATIKVVDGKIKTNRAVNWNETIKLWHEDPEAKENKTLVRYEDSEIFQIYYNKKGAVYNNRSIYKFVVNQSLKRRLVPKIQNKEIDALKFK